MLSRVTSSQPRWYAGRDSNSSSVCEFAQPSRRHAPRLAGRSISPPASAKKRPSPAAAAAGHRVQVAVIHKVSSRPRVATMSAAGALHCSATHALRGIIKSEKRIHVSEACPRESHRHEGQGHVGRFNEAEKAPAVTICSFGVKEYEDGIGGSHHVT